MKNRFIIKTTVAAICAAAIALCSGCAVTEKESAAVCVTSYVSSDSTVFSSTAELVKQVAPSVVEIQTSSIATQWNMQYVVSGAGSGVIVGRGDDSTYYIITNNHVVSGARDITIALRTGEKYEAKLIAADERGDIAVVSIKSDNVLGVAMFGDSAGLQVGEDVIAIGNPLGSLGGTVTKGIISATERSIPMDKHSMTLLQTDTAINPGNSGGGLFNMRGELIGVVNAKMSDEEVEGICFAIPINTAKSIYDDLVKNGVVTGRVTLGITVAASSSGEVVYVSEVPASVKSGTFRKYDRISKINGKTINSLLAYNDALATVKPNEQVSITVYRGSLVQTFFGSQLTFDDAPTTFTVTAEQVKAQTA